MYFFEDIYAPCERCDGTRFKPEILAIRYRARTISDVLAFTVDEARSFFSGTPKLQERLHLLSSIGLGYLRLGQSATTLSGGEAQRLKDRGRVERCQRKESPLHHGRAHDRSAHG